MRYIVKETTDGVMYDIHYVDDDYVLGEYETEVTVEEANSIPVPCKIIDGEYVPAEAPDNSVECEVEPEKEAEPTTDEVLNALLGVTE